MERSDSGIEMMLQVQSSNIVGSLNEFQRKFEFGLVSVLFFSSLAFSLSRESSI